MERYIRNRETITDRDQKLLKNAHVAVAGCGGLGGYVLEQLARSGVGHLTAIDGDVFEASNLNRQLLATTGTLGHKKAMVVREHLHDVNPEVVVNSYQVRLTEQNADVLLQNHEIVVDALDNLPSRQMLQSVCERLGIPIVHGAIAGWYGQLAVIYPGGKTLDKLYRQPDKTDTDKYSGIERKLGNPSFSAGLVASLQTAEVIKLLLGKESPLRTHVMRIDLLEMDFFLLALDNDK